MPQRPALHQIGASKRQRTSSRSAGTPAVRSRKATAAKHKALRATTVDPVVTQELGAVVPATILTEQSSPFLPAVEILGFMGRAASALQNLPLAMMRCRTPFEMWGEQNRLLHSVFADFQKVSVRVMGGALNAGAEGARRGKVKKRGQADK